MYLTLYRILNIIDLETNQREDGNGPIPRVCKDTVTEEVTV